MKKPTQLDLFTDEWTMGHFETSLTHRIFTTLSNSVPSSFFLFSHFLAAIALFLPRFSFNFNLLLVFLRVQLSFTLSLSLFFFWHFSPPCSLIQSSAQVPQAGKQWGHRQRGSQDTSTHTHTFTSCKCIHSLCNHCGKVISAWLCSEGMWMTECNQVELGMKRAANTNCSHSDVERKESG